MVAYICIFCTFTECYPLFWGAQFLYYLEVTQKSLRNVTALIQAELFGGVEGKKYEEHFQIFALFLSFYICYCKFHTL